jgi:hypothetical protein
MWADWLRRTLKMRDRETDGIQPLKSRDPSGPQSFHGPLDLETVAPRADTLSRVPSEDRGDGEFRA